MGLGCQRNKTMLMWCLNGTETKEYMHTHSPVVHSIGSFRKVAQYLHPCHRPRLVLSPGSRFTTCWIFHAEMFTLIVVNQCNWLNLVGLDINNWWSFFYGQMIRNSNVLLDVRFPELENWPNLILLDLGTVSWGYEGEVWTMMGLRMILRLSLLGTGIYLYINTITGLDRGNG